MMNNSFLPTIAIAIITACYSAIIGLLVGLSEPEYYKIDETAVEFIVILGAFIVIGLWFALYTENKYPNKS